MATQRKSGKEELVEHLLAALRLNTKKEAEALIRVFETCIEETLIEHLDEDDYSIKFGSFGRFIVHHRPAIRRKMGLTGEVRDFPPRSKVKFIGLGRLRKLERVR